MAGNSTPEGAAHARKIRWQRHHADPDKWFWTRVDRTAGDGACWPWLGRIMVKRRGYGRLKFKGVHTAAHRMALILSSGENRQEEFACHTCDNPPCCNPAHLFWGTPLENTQDMDAKGRRRSKERKIDINKLKERRTAGLSYSELAAEFCVNQASIGKALRKVGLSGAVRPNQNASLRARSRDDG